MRKAEVLQNQCTTCFGDMLKIHSEVIVLNATDQECKGMKMLRTALKERKQHIIVSFNISQIKA